MRTTGIDCELRLEVAGKELQTDDIVELSEHLYEGSHLRARVPSDPAVDAKPGSPVSITFRAAGSTANRKVELWCSSVARFEDGTQSYLELEAVDPLRLLNLESQFATYRGKRTLSELAGEVFRRHLGSLAESISLPRSAPTVEADWLLQCHETGADFIQRLARMCGVMFFWNGSALSLGEIGRGPRDDAPVTLDWSTTLVSSWQQFRPGITERSMSWVDPVTRRSHSKRVNGEGLTSKGSGLLGLRVPALSLPGGGAALGGSCAAATGEILCATTMQSDLALGRSVKSASGSIYALQSITHVIHSAGSYQNQLTATDPAVWGLLLAPVRGRLVGPFSATVVENNDPARYGRIRVRLDEDSQGLVTPWVSALSIQSGASRGCFWLPEVGDHVLTMAPEDCPENLTVLGSVWGEQSQPDQDWAGRENGHKVLAFRNGVQIVVDDEAEILRLQTRSGSLELTGEGKLTISANDIEVLAANGIDVRARGIMKLDGQQIHLGT